MRLKGAIQEAILKKTGNKVTKCNLKEVKHYKAVVPVVVSI